MSSFQNIISSCEAGYNAFNEDKRSFNPGWTSLYNLTTGPLTNYSSSITEAFMYNDSTTLGTYSYTGDHASYDGGGYVYEFRGKISEIIGNISLLRELSWVDIQTRAVIIQMSLYNPNVGLFAFVTILAELLPTGGVFPSARVEPISLLSSYNGINNYY
jgi:polycystin 1L2